jgi:hypothetical protein
MDIRSKQKRAWTERKGNRIEWLAGIMDGDFAKGCFFLNLEFLRPLSTVCTTVDSTVCMYE